jgi:hypothetical protein
MGDFIGRIGIIISQFSQVYILVNQMVILIIFPLHINIYSYLCVFMWIYVYLCIAIRNASAPHIALRRLGGATPLDKLIR